MKIWLILGVGGLVALVSFPLAVTEVQSAVTVQWLKTWALSAAPTLRIGKPGDPNKEFFRIARVMRSTSGQIVVANAATYELRLFSAAGEFVRSLSRRGNGPGELDNFVSVSAVADTVFVFEHAPGSSELHVFTIPNGFVRRTRVTAANAPRGVSIYARLTSGDLFIADGGGVRVVRPPPVGKVSRDTTTLGILRSSNPGRVAWLGKFPGNSWFGYAVSSAPGGVTLARHTLAPLLVTGASGDQVWVGDSGTGLITIFKADGTSAARVMMPTPSRPFSEKALNRARQRALEKERDPMAQARYEMLYSKEIRPRTAPFFSRFVPSVDGEVGIELFREDESERGRMIVFDRAGKPRGTITVPPNTTVHEIGRYYVVGVHTDDDGVETVVMYRLKR